MNISIKNLDAPLGAEIASVDLSKPLSQDDVETIEETWRERLVVVFRGQRLSDPQLLAFSRNFGELDPPGPNPYGEPFNKQHPEINVISNVIENGKPIVSGIRSIICIRLRPRSLMSSDSEPTASSGDWALDRLSSGESITKCISWLTFFLTCSLELGSDRLATAVGVRRYSAFSNQ